MRIVELAGGTVKQRDCHAQLGFSKGIPKTISELALLRDCARTREQAGSQANELRVPFRCQPGFQI